MEEQWYYNVNYPPQGVPNYNLHYPGAQVLSNHYHQSQNNVPYVPYPSVPTYPPPVVGPYNVPPPSVTPQANFGYSYTYQAQQYTTQNHYEQLTNDYIKELENYKFIKAQLGEEKLEVNKLKESMDPNGNGAAGFLAVPRKSEVQESSNAENLDFVYSDSDNHANEIAELYSYTEYSDLQNNLSAFEEQMSKYHLNYLTWRHFTVKQKTSVIMKVLDQLELSNRDERMKSARCILYIAQGGWLGIQSDLEQLNSARESCLLLYKLGAFSAFVDLFNLEIENNSSTTKKTTVSLADSEDLRVILSVLYTITEVIRNEKESEPAIYAAFCNDIINASENDLMILKLFNMLTKFCSGAAPHFPVKKILIFLWKLILLSLGGTDELRDLKAQKREKAGLSSQKEDTITIAKTMRPSSPPAFAADLLEDQNQRRKRSLMKQTSLEDNENIEMEMMGNEDNPEGNKNDIGMANWQDVTSMLSEKQKKITLPWTPKVHKKEIDIFLNGAREKFIGYSLEGDSTTLFGLPKPIHDSIETLKEHIYISLTELEIQKEEDIGRNPFSTKDEIETTPTEILYQVMFPNLPQYVICLLKILLATTSRVKSSSDSINILGDVLPKEMPMTVYQSMKLGIDINRHKEIIVKAISAILLLLLKHFKLNHVYQFEFMSQHLVFANCIPLILKFFNQEVLDYVKAGNSIPVLDFPSCVLGDFQPEMNASIEIGSDTNHCWRNVFSSINLLRVLNKLCKWKNSRIMMLVIFKSAPILKRTLKIRHAMAQLYVLKLIKMQTKYLGRNWRKSNLKTVSLIYQKVRHHLNDDWAYGNYLDAKPWDFQAEEVALRSAVDKFNNRRYLQICDKEFEPIDNDLNSVLGHDFDLSSNFQKYYYRWLEDEVFSNEIHWEELF